jgi:hypothetical protein
MSQLTVEQITVMPAGRELDALVAEQAMGWNVCGTADNDKAGIAPGQQCSAVRIPKYSTDIASAWDVLMKVQDVGSLQNFGGFGWRCEIHATGPGTRDCAGEADTAPLAICRAALLWVVQR